MPQGSRCPESQLLPDEVSLSIYRGFTGNSRWRGIVVPPPPMYSLHGVLVHWIFPQTAVTLPSGCCKIHLSLSPRFSHFFSRLSSSSDVTEWESLDYYTLGIGKWRLKSESESECESGPWSREEKRERNASWLCVWRYVCVNIYPTVTRVVTSIVVGIINELGTTKYRRIFFDVRKSSNLKNTNNIYSWKVVPVVPGQSVAQLGPRLPERIEEDYKIGNAGIRCVSSIK